MLVVFSGCSKEKFAVESNWLAPLLKADLGITDLVADSLINSNSNGEVVLSYGLNYTVNDLEDVLVVPDKTEVLEATLSSLVLENRSFTDTITLFDLYPESILFHNRRTVLEAQDITANESTTIDVSEQFFKSAKFKEGFIDIQIKNELPVEAEIIEFELLNNSDKSVIVSGLFNNLQPFGTVQETYSLADKQVDGVLDLKVKRIKTKASDGEVLVDVYKGLITTFTVRDLKPEYATAIFPAQDLITQNTENRYQFGGAELTQIVVESGTVLMKVESTIQEAIQLEYEIPLSSKPGSPGPIQQSWYIPPAEPGKTVEIEERFPIDGYAIILKGKDPNQLPTFNHIYSELVARTEYSGKERTLSLNDKVKIEFGLVDIKPLLIIGDPGKHDYSFNDTLILDELKKIEGNLSLEDAEIALNVENSFGIEAQMIVNNIVGLNTRNGKNVALQSPNLKDPIFVGRAVNATEFIPATKSLVLNKDNSNLKLFLENLPDEIIADIAATIRPNGTIDQGDFAFNHSTLDASLDLEVPLKLNANELTLRSTGNIDWSSVENIEGVQQLKLMVRAENDFPLDAEIAIFFLDEKGAVITGLSDSARKVLAADLDPVSRHTVGSTTSELEFSLNRQQTQAVLASASQIQIETIFNSPQAYRAPLKDTYRLNVKVIADATYKTGF
jgi:hypothetical protein